MRRSDLYELWWSRQGKEAPLMARRVMLALSAVAQALLGVVVFPFLLVAIVVAAPFRGAFILGRAVVDGAMAKLDRDQCADCPRYPRIADLRTDWKDREAAGGFPSVCRRCAERRGVPPLPGEGGCS